ncbi:ORF6 [Halorubrum pleomorphic virus 11]|uniref:ORF6 n=1 Tax=Halorubrum pleomorphic virus 11 TaxID=2507577 RepID=A0A410N6W7_9VIRU|nr:ORF6 [Halorubrum pleomorphic virus 11]QAS68907.1 ORF6 [Halorubrum pleomorphic virus 11]
MSIVDYLRDNSRLVIAGVLFYVAAASYGYVTPVWEMDGFYAAATAGVVALGAGYFAAGKVESLLPEEEGIYLVAFESSDDTGGSVWELSEDQFEAMEVHAGTLFEWPVSKRVYECKEYRPEDNVAVANWRESVAGSQLAGDALLPDALEQIAELREEFEPEARRSRYLQRRLRSIARTIDRERLKDQQELLDNTTNPTFGDSQSISEIIEEQVPPSLRPESMNAGEMEQKRNGESEEIVGFDLLDDSEALDFEGQP